MIYLLNPVVLILWSALSWIIGLLGRNKRFGFFGNFLISFFFSPLVGVIVLLASDDRPVVLRRR
jgi:hypothetical protein